MSENPRRKSPVIISLITTFLVIVLLSPTVFLWSRLNMVQQRLNVVEEKLTALAKVVPPPLPQVLTLSPTALLVSDPSWSLLERQQLLNSLQIIITLIPETDQATLAAINNSKLQLATDIDRYFELQNQLIDKLVTSPEIAVSNKSIPFLTQYLPIKIMQKTSTVQKSINDTATLLPYKIVELLYYTPQKALDRLTELKQLSDFVNSPEINALYELFDKYLNTPLITTI